jgi:phosphoribosylaminoimidazole-succinocarboxamide synthase
MERFWGVDMASQTRIAGLNHLGQGKVRDIYAIGHDSLLLVASDRISAFDVVMSEPIPNKGQVLTQLAAFWFNKTSDIVSNHLISADDREVQVAVEAAGGTWSDWLNGRVMLCQRTKPLAVEAVVRGYLSGSGSNATPTTKVSKRLKTTGNEIVHAIIAINFPTTSHSPASSFQYGVTRSQTADPRTT